MAAKTNISWCDHTFNPWVGCSKISLACDHCYAEIWAKRSGHTELWLGHRRRTTEANWLQPLKWDAAARAAGTRVRVFCASLADVFDNLVPPQWRIDLFELIGKTTNIDWLLLTKRIGNAHRMLDEVMDVMSHGLQRWGEPMAWPDVWLGITVCNQAEADRDIPKLLTTPARVRFLSCEPLLGPIDLRGLLQRCPTHDYAGGFCIQDCGDWQRLNWVIAGGESGGKARPSHPDWFRSLRDQCVAAGVPFHFKQWGSWMPHRPQAGGDLGGDVRRGRVTVVHPTGESDVEVFQRTGGRNTIPGTRYVIRIDKKVAGRTLDGVVHDSFPEVRS
jgi:protein gp37